MGCYSISNDVTRILYIWGRRQQPTIEASVGSQRPKSKQKPKFKHQNSKTKIQSNSMTSDGAHRWLLEKPLLEAFQPWPSTSSIRGRQIQSRVVAPISGLSGFRYVTKPRLAPLATGFGDLGWSSEMARWKATSKGFLTSHL